MNDSQKNYITLGVSLLGAIKLTLESFGYNVISDEQINAIANLAAVILTIGGIVMTHRKKQGVSQ